MKNHRLIQRLLLIVAVLALAATVTVFIGYRRVTRNPDVLLDLIKNEADMQLNKIRQTATKNGIREWRLEAESATLLEKQKTMLLAKPDVEFFMDDGDNVHLTADQGTIYTDSSRLHISGQVTASTNRYRFQAEALDYDPVTRELRADVPVILSGQSFTLRADSMAMDLKNNTARFEGGVEEPSVKTFSFRYMAGWVLPMWLGLMLLAPLNTTGMAETKTPKPATADAETKKIHITSQRLISNMADKEAEFIGNVRASQGDTSLTADSLKIFVADQSEAGQTSPAQSLEKLVATGNVEIKFDNWLAVARQAVYITAQRMLILTGPGATVTSGENTITGETITFYRDDGRFAVEGGSNGRVTAVILPETSGLE